MVHGRTLRRIWGLLTSGIISYFSTCASGSGDIGTTLAILLKALLRTSNCWRQNLTHKDCSFFLAFHYVLFAIYMYMHFSDRKLPLYTKLMHHRFPGTWRTPGTPGGFYEPRTPFSLDCHPPFFILHCCKYGTSTSAWLFWDFSPLYYALFHTNISSEWYFFHPLLY